MIDSFYIFTQSHHMFHLRLSIFTALFLLFHESLLCRRERLVGVGLADEETNLGTPQDNSFGACFQIIYNGKINLL